MNFEKNADIYNWKQFRKKVRNKGTKLLSQLDKFPNAILVTGCQRSGTTLITRLIAECNGIKHFWISKDDELDAALVLSGYINIFEPGRFCFQTTYLNENYKEYYDHDIKYKLVWVIRHPYSVIYSMVYNWKRFALNELFWKCAMSNHKNIEYTFSNNLKVKPIIKAALAYNAKLRQLIELYDHFHFNNSLIVIDYDELVSNSQEILGYMSTKLQLEDLQSKYISIHNNSIKKFDKLNISDKLIISEICVPLYSEIKYLIS